MTRFVDFLSRQDSVAWNWEIPVPNPIAGTSVAINTVGGAADLLKPCAPGLAQSQFLYGDNVLIESITLVTPYQFGRGEKDICIELEVEDMLGGRASINELVNGIVVPTIGCEIPLNLFLDNPSGSLNVGEEWFFVVQSIAGDVSLLNVPDDLAGQDLPIWPVLKVASTQGGGN